MQPARWYRLVGEDVVGPARLEELRAAVLSGGLGPDDLVWADGMPDWLPAGRVPALVPPPRLRRTAPEPGDTSPDAGPWSV